MHDLLKKIVTNILFGAKFAMFLFRLECLQKFIYIEKQRSPLVDYLPSINSIYLFSEIGDNMSYAVLMAAALSLTLFSNIVIFFYYSGKVEKKKQIQSY